MTYRFVMTEPRRGVTSLAYARACSRPTFRSRPGQLLAYNA